MTAPLEGKRNSFLEGFRELNNSYQVILIVKEVMKSNLTVYFHLHMLQSDYCLFPNLL